MDATLSNYRKRLLPALLALSMGLALPLGAWSAESDSSPKRSARGTVVFVTPQSSTQSQGRHSETRSQATNSPNVNTPSPRSAQGDLKLVPKRHLQPSFQRTQSESTAAVTRETAQPQLAQQSQPTKPTNSRRLIDAMRNRTARPPAEQATPEERVRVVQHQEEIDSSDLISKLLIEAHSISLDAKTEAEYSKIIQHSTTALRQSDQKEERRFARQLASWALNRRGKIRTDQGQQELADADFQKALGHNSNNWRALHNRGVSFAQQGAFAEAFDDFNQVIQLNPKYAKAYANRATLFMQAGDSQSALEDYQFAAEIDPAFSTAQLGIGRIQHMLGQWDEAIPFFEAAVQLDPANAEILCSRGDLFADMGQYGKALADYARAIEVNPEFAHAYRNGSWLLATCPDAQFRDPENAMLGARQALEFGYGQRHVTLDTLAAALASAGQYNEAIRTLRDALAIAPEESKPAYTQRLQLYRQRQPFRTEPTEEVSQAVFEVTDR